MNPRRRPSFQEILAKWVFLVAEQGGLVGYAQLVTVEREVKSGLRAVRNERAGDRRCLLDEIESAGRDRKIEALQLKASLYAVPFYVTQGYERLERATHRLAGGVELPCVRMRKIL